MTLTQAIKNEARRLGFALAGITTPESPPHWPVYQNWLAMGRHGSMDYLSDPRRADPRLVLPECQSIVMLAIRYPDPGAVTQDEGLQLRGRVAAYAWGRDYHLVLPERLNALAAFIEAITEKPVPHRAYTDTGPLLERDLAQRAGLGWIGKNTCLIHPQIGSCFFLAELLIGIELQPDPPFQADRCGTCTRCLQACPTGCILPDRTLDARRCISYLTIENKKEIPLELRAQIGNHVFGCDICQQVCPWNRHVSPGPEPVFALRDNDNLPTPDLLSELMLTPQEFNRKYKDSPLQRARRSGYLRNVAVALGNIRDPSARAALAAAAGAAEPLLQEHVLWALERIENNSILPSS